MAARVLPDSSPGLASQAEASGSEEDESSIWQSRFLTQIPNPPSKRPTRRLPAQLHSPTMPYTTTSGVGDDIFDLVSTNKNVARREQRSVGGLKARADESLMNKENKTTTPEPTSGQPVPRPQVFNIQMSPAKAPSQAVGSARVQSESCQSEQTSRQCPVGGDCSIDSSLDRGRKVADGEHCNKQQTEEPPVTPDPWAKWRGSLISGRPCIPRTAQIIPRPQLKLLATDSRWQPPLIGHPMIPGNVPLDLLNCLTAAADTAAVELERLSSPHEPQATQHQSNLLEDSAEISTEAGRLSQQKAQPSLAALSGKVDSEDEEEPESFVNSQEWPPSLPPSSAEPSLPKKGTSLPPNSSVPASAAEHQLQVSRAPALVMATSSAPFALETTRQRPTSSSQRIPATVAPDVRRVRQAHSPAHSPVDLPQYEVLDGEESAKEEVRVPQSTPSPDQQLKASQQLWADIDRSALRSDREGPEESMKPARAPSATLSSPGHAVKEGSPSGPSSDGEEASRQEYNSQPIVQSDMERRGQAEVKQKPKYDLPAKRSAPHPQDLSPERKRVKLTSIISDQSSTSEDVDFEKHKARTRELRREFFAAKRTDHDRLPFSPLEFPPPQNKITSTARLAPTSQNVDTRSPSPRSSSLRSYQQRGSGHSLIRQITTSTPITSMSHHHATGMAQSSLLRAASQASSTQSHLLENILSAYKSAYPEYTGSLSQFARSCQLIRRLSDEGRPLPQGVLDDFIYRHHHDYRAYLADVIGSAELESLIPYERYYLECVDEPVYCKRIVKKVFIDVLATGDSVESLVRSMYAQQSARGSYKLPPPETSSAVLPQVVSRRSYPRSVAASESASNVQKIAPSSTTKLEVVEKTTAPSNSLEDQLHRKEQDSKKQSQESSVEEWLEHAGGGSPELGTPVDAVSSQVPALDLTEESEMESELVRALHQPRPVSRPLQTRRRPPTRSAEKTVFQNFLEANSRLGAERQIWTSSRDDCPKQVRPEVQKIIDIFSWRQ